MHSLMLSHTKAPGFLNAPAVSHLQGFAHAGPSVRPQTAHHTSCRKWDPTTSGPSVWIQGPRWPSFEGLDFRDRGWRRSWRHSTHLCGVHQRGLCHQNLRGRKGLTCGRQLGRARLARLGHLGGVTADPQAYLCSQKYRLLMSFPLVSHLV